MNLTTSLTQMVNSGISLKNGPGAGNMSKEKRSFNFIDLFAGAGGLSEGFVQAGFSPVAHVEMNPFAAKTL